MDVLLLFGLFPKETRGNILENSIGVVQNAADSLQWSLVNGLTYYYNNLNLINLPYIGSYPKLYNKKKERDYEFVISDNPNNPKAKNIGFNNFFGIRMFSRYFNAKKALVKWHKENQNEKVIIIYSINIPFLKAAVDIKKKNRNIKICVIVPDIPIYKWANENKLINLLNSIQNKILIKLYPFVDNYVLLTEYMKDLLPIENKKFTVIEGIYNNEFENQNICTNNKIDNVKTIFYAGTLAHRYGILNLVRAFQKLKNNDYRLVICGDGSAKKEIYDIAQYDTRIILKGQLSRDEVLKLMIESDLLVNPRTPEGVYTKYSFPSKTIEYLGSGIPTLLYKLDGIPNEYYNYCFVIEDTSVDGLANKIEEILSMPTIFLKEMGSASKRFIMREKNPIKQCEKLVMLIENN